MTIDDKIIDEKIQYDIDGEATKISGLSSSKFDKYKHLTGEDKDIEKLVDRENLVYGTN